MINKNELWIVFEYEVEMFIGTSILLASQYPEVSIQRNALIESRLLHTRILVDILLDKEKSPDDITLSKLLKGIELSDELTNAIEELRTAYGNNQQEKSPCWTLNKILVHSTTHRSNAYDWGSTLNTIDPHIYKILQLLAELGNRDTLTKLLSQ